MILREGVQRRIVISANVAGPDLGTVVDEMRTAVARDVPMPPGYRVEYGGQFESEQSASRRLLLQGIAVVAGVFTLLVMAFGQPRDAMLIMPNLPLALIGGVAGVFLAGGVLSVASMIGFITLVGIATRNGIMLVSHIHHLIREEGITEFREAVVRGACERLIPILMTALAAGLALVPLALGGGKAGSEIQTPMAIVILGGLMSSTLLNMVVVPTLYLRYGNRPERLSAQIDWRVKCLGGGTICERSSWWEASQQPPDCCSAGPQLPSNRIRASSQAQRSPCMRRNSTTCTTAVTCSLPDASTWSAG